MTADIPKEEKNGIDDTPNGIHKAEESERDPENHQEHVAYPKRVFFIVGNEFCERFCFYGMRTILFLYLTDILHYNKETAMVIYHSFAMFAYFFPLVGAIISDSWLGKFKTIMYLSIIYVIGNILLAVASDDEIGLPQIPFSFLALILIAVGTGGIKPCVSSFGGDQFVLPQQEIQLAAFFSVFYFSINAGSLISTFLTPVLRENVKCFGKESCYPLAFFVPGVLMIVAIVLFVLGSKWYTVLKPQGNIIVKVCQCIWHALRTRAKSAKDLDHWLDHSKEAFGESLVNDVKTSLRVMLIFVPLPIFWTLYDQQGSGWTYQAVRMDGNIGFYTVLPDQMQVVNPLLILALIPIFTYGVYPWAAKCNRLTGSLERMVWGGFLTAAAFAISAGVSFALEATYPVLPEAGEAQIRVYNPTNCEATLNIPALQFSQKIGSMGYHKLSPSGIKGNVNGDYQVVSDCGLNVAGSFVVDEKTTLFYHLTAANAFLGGIDDIEKPTDGLPRIRTLVSNPQPGLSLTYTNEDDPLVIPTTNFTLIGISPGTSHLSGWAAGLEFKLGGVYTVLVKLGANSAIEDVKVIEITEPNSVHMFWLIPQYVVITVGEILFSVTGLEFAYSEAPVSMKSVMTAMFLLTSAIGNLIIVIIESIHIFDKQSYDFLLYTGLMILDMVLFTFMAIQYNRATRKIRNSLAKPQPETLEDNDEKPSRLSITHRKLEDKTK